jgi:TRAP-type C4-dicarboxylate transport system substrate-binding protein
MFQRTIRFIESALAAVLAVGCLAVVGSASAQPVVKMTVTAGHPPVFAWVKLIDDFVIPEIEKRVTAIGSPVKFEWTRAYGGTVAKLGAESDAMRTDISDMGIVAAIFEAGKFPLEQFSLMTPFSTSDMRLINRVTYQMHQDIPELMAFWTRNNIVYLGGASIDTYHILTKFPLTSVDALKGKKILAPGPAANWIRNTGAVAVSGNLNTYYNDLKSGVADGVIVSMVPAASAKLHEVVPHITKVNIGAQSTGALGVNKRTLEKLPKEVQKIFIEVGRAYADEFAKVQMATADQALKTMIAAGAKVAELDPAERKRWADTLPPLGREWAADLDAKGMPGTRILKSYIEGLSAGGVQFPRDWTR